MKTRLLRKVRKNYKIIYYPEGYVSKSGSLYFKNAFVLYFKGEIIRAEFNNKTLIDFLTKHMKFCYSKNNVLQFMKNYTSQIKCPKCQTLILMDNKRLMLGDECSCYRCNFTFSIPLEDRSKTAKEAINILRKKVKENSTPITYTDWMI